MKKKTEILCIMDRSGSMAHIMDESIGAFNQFVEAQKKLPGKGVLTLAIFDNNYELVHDRVKLEDVPALTKETAFARGMTALNDAVGKTITSAKGSKQTICLIQTDGFENASKEYTANDIKLLVEKKEKDGWEFVFVGAGIDAFKAGSAFGLNDAQCVNVGATAKGMENYSAAMDARTMAYRSN